MWNCPYSTDYFDRFSENFDDKDNSASYSMLSEVASRKGITIVGGSIPEWHKNQLFNTCCVFGPNGELLAIHRKVRLSIWSDMSVENVMFRMKIQKVTSISLCNDSCRYICLILTFLEISISRNLILLGQETSLQSSTLVRMTSKF